MVDTKGAGGQGQLEVAVVSAVFISYVFHLNHYKLVIRIKSLFVLFFTGLAYKIKSIKYIPNSLCVRVCVCVTS